MARWPKLRRISHLLDQDYINAVKARRGCEGPGPHEGPLTFHHKDPSKKVEDVSKLAYLGVGRETLDREIGRCTVLCEGCHRRVEAEKRLRRNSHSLVISQQGV